MDNTFIEKLNIELEEIYRTTNFKNSNINEELVILVEKFDNSIVPLLETKQAEAEKYYEEREEYTNIYAYIFILNFFLNNFNTI